MAAECHSRFGFQFQSKLRVEFDGGTITGDAGLVLLREFDERLALTADLKKLLIDERDRRPLDRIPAVDTPPAGGRQPRAAPPARKGRGSAAWNPLSLVRARQSFRPPLLYQVWAPPRPRLRCVRNVD